MNRYQEIKAFVAVAREGSLVGASHKEKITSSMLGRRIDTLEKRLGVKLLHRTTRHLSLTEQGALFLEHCHELLTDIERSEASLFPETSEISGQLRVLAPAHFGRQHVALHARTFVSKHPNVQLSFDLTNDYSDPVREGYDLCIRIGNVIDPDFITTKLLSNRRVVCATPAYFQKYGVPKTLEDLEHHNCLAVNLTAGQHRDWLFQEAGRLVSVKVDGNVDCNDGEVLADWARKGLGLAWRSTWEVGSELASGELVTVLDEYALPSFDVTAVHPRHKARAAIRLFIETLQNAYAQSGYWTETSETIARYDVALRP
jgi:DNA-binding transcriptional LysR family regulator